MLSLEDYKEIYRLLDMATPLDMDCGKMCGKACCVTDGKYEENICNNYFFESYDDFELEDLVLHLMPGEEKMFDMDKDFSQWEEALPSECELPDSWETPLIMVRCKGKDTCDRKKRPIQCRTFPLTPYLTEGGTLLVMLNPDILPYHCPIIEEKMKMNTTYVENTKEAWRILISDKAIYDMVYDDSRFREELGVDVESMIVM